MGHAGFLAVDGVVAARDPHFFPEQQLPHHRPSALLLFEADEPDHVEDVSGFAEAKVAALLEHRSQWLTTHEIADAADQAQVDRFTRRVVDGLAGHGAAAGVAHGEAFKAIFDL